MTIQIWTFILVGLSFSLYIGIAIWTRASSTKEFYSADQSVNPILNGMATAADWMSAASFISMAGIVSFAGYDGSVYLLGWTGGYVILALLLAPYLRKFGKFTIPDFIGDRYYSKTARLIAVFCAIFISFTYIAGQMRGVGVVFSRFLEVDIDLGVLIGMSIVFLYAVLGGMKGITYTQVAQFCVLIFAFMLPAFFTSILLTGSPIPQIGFGDTLTAEPSVYLLDRIDQISQDLGFGLYTEGTKSTIDVFAITLALMIGTAGLPHVLIRFFTVPSVKDARISAAWTLVFIAILYTTAPAIAAFARLNMFNSINLEDNSGVKIEDTPDWVKNWSQTGLVTAEDKNKDGRYYYAAPQNPKNELTINRDIVVLASPELAKLPNWVIALLAAGGLAAALSTAAGLLLVISTAISHDLMKKILKPNMNEKQELKMARIAATIAIFGAGYLGINPPGFVAEVVAFSFGLAASSFFPALFLGIFMKKMNKEGAITGIVTGITFTATYIIYFKFINPENNLPENWLWGISPEGIGSIGMVINFITAFVIYNFTKPAPKDIQELVENIRLPKSE